MWKNHTQPLQPGTSSWSPAWLHTAVGWLSILQSQILEVASDSVSIVNLEDGVWDFKYGDVVMYITISPYLCTSHISISLHTEIASNDDNPSF